MVVTTFFLASRNAKEQARLRDEATAAQQNLSNQLSGANGKLDAISHFEGQFLSFLSQQRPNTSDAATRAYMATALAVIKAAGSGKPPSLREKILQLSNEILTFVEDRSAVQPQLPPQPAGSTTMPEQYVQQFHDWWKNTDDQYVGRFAARAATVLNEAKASGIDTYDADSNCSFVALPSEGSIHDHFRAMQNCGRYLGVIAEKTNL